jgi:hypothetical protein
VVQHSGTCHDPGSYTRLPAAKLRRGRTSLQRAADCTPYALLITCPTSWASHSRATCAQVSGHGRVSETDAPREMSGLLPAHIRLIYSQPGRQCVLIVRAALSPNNVCYKSSG